MWVCLDQAPTNVILTTKDNQLIILLSDRTLLDLASGEIVVLKAKALVQVLLTDYYYYDHYDQHTQS